MSISSGYADLQIDTNDKSKTARYKLSWHGSKKTVAHSKAENIRKRGKKARVVKEGSEWVVYSRG